MDEMREFRIEIPTDEGFTGCACPEKKCGQYFKLFVSNFNETVNCPYCGVDAAKSDLLTTSQHKLVIDEVVEEFADDLEAHTLAMLGGTLGAGSSSLFNTSVTGTPRRSRKQKKPGHVERTVDTEFQCPQCSTRFQVYGIFGYCPGCRLENLQVFDANWHVIETEVQGAEHASRALRHAYSDLVAAFESFCKGKAIRVSKEACNFQDLFETRKFFKRNAGCDILAEVATQDGLSLRRVFQKRHVYVHNDGNIGERYIRLIPEDKSLLNTKATLSLEELRVGAGAIRNALAKLVKSLELPG